MTYKPYNFTQRLTKGKWEVLLDPVAKYGCFEHEDTGTGGGLWFEKDGDLLTLTDYDGVYEMPRAVGEALREMGCVVDSEFFD